MNKHQSSLSLRGFTLVETLVSVAIFTMAISLGVMALVSVSQSSARVRVRDQAIQSAYYVMDSMSRSIRTGVNYSVNQVGVTDCPSRVSGLTNSYTEFYYLDQQGYGVGLKYDPTTKTLQRVTTTSSVAGGSPNWGVWKPLHDPRSVTLESIYFSTSGNDCNTKTSNDLLQPSVSILAEFSYIYKGKLYTIPIQTMLTQRFLDVSDDVGGANYFTLPDPTN